MRKIKFIIFSVFSFVILTNASSCDGSSDSVTGSPEVVEIEHVNFTNLTRSITNNSLIVSGTIVNTSETSTITPTWKIECQFYVFDDEIATNKLLGGDNTTITNALNPGTALDWTIDLNISNANDYEDFTVSDLRAIK